MTTPRAGQSRALTISAGVHAIAAHSPRRRAIATAARTLSYGDMALRIRKVAGGCVSLLARTLGERAVLLAPNCVEYPEIVCGASDAGMIVATVNPRVTARELEQLAADCEPQLVFVHSTLANVVAAASLPSVRKVIVLGPDYERWLAGCGESGVDEGLHEDDAFALVYTSGTTGTPKGVLLSHRSRVLTFFAMAMEYACFGPEDRHLAIAPMAHGAGFAFSMAPLFFGGCVEIVEKFDPEYVLARLAAGQHTGTFMVPTHYQAIFALAPASLQRYCNTTPALRAIISNAAALPRSMKEKIIAYWGAGLLHETYGATESGIITNLRPAEQLSRPGSVGRAFTCTKIRLLDDAGEPVADGEVGELFSNSPFLFSGYYKLPAATAACLREGAVSVGDLACRDEDGCITIVDRKTDLVISGGLNVYPREIEDVLHRHPAIREAAVIGVPDEKWGEALRAFVVMHDGVTLDHADIEAHCRAALGGYKVPRSYHQIQQLPRNASGKVLKRALRDA